MKKSILFVDEDFIALLLFKTYPAVINTLTLAALVAMTQNVFRLSSLRAGYYNVNLHGLPTTGKCCNALAPQALYSIEFLTMSLSNQLF